ncbi:MULTISPECIES: helix-turn-helix domain-containing protein [unclassified Lactococcus]|uniref:helix-turn-helix domain-containing protein n=1 Tax=unclassified Lactococcus TaxID=2643510 RepID=UPI0011C87F81|nr:MULTISPECIES: helix-turn-helix transcriptional regulator [unclassified Lactococcus]MQW23273.1 helix-turn-helix domain-containing protein [Lactococcus sp. dk101]TXK38060.1 helix-turn-helix transcriptional regulator [Lactococcus sp. dk310]TXK49739.1 helix-turn-helix transcriptional regulator [Lactococcus sp. dk322]
MNKIKELRKERKLTLAKLAQMFNEQNVLDKDGNQIKMSDSQLSTYENGSRSPRHNEVWIGLANIFEVSELYLMGYDNETLKKTLDNALTNASDLMEKLELNPDDFLQLKSLNKSVKLIKGLSDENNEKWLEYGKLLLESQNKSS